MGVQCDVVGIVGVDVVGQCVNLHLCVRRSGVLGVEMKTLPVKLLLTFTRSASHCDGAAPTRRCTHHE